MQPYTTETYVGGQTGKCWQERVGLLPRRSPHITIYTRSTEVANLANSKTVPPNRRFGGDTAATKSKYSATEL